MIEQQPYYLIKCKNCKAIFTYKEPHEVDGEQIITCPMCGVDNKHFGFTTIKELEDWIKEGNGK